VEIRFAKSAYKHRISRARILAAIENASPARRRKPEHPGDHSYLWWVGLDDRGVELEVGGFYDENGDLVIFHSMPTWYRGNNRGRVTR